MPPRVRRKPQGFGQNQRVRQKFAPQPDRSFPRPERPGNRLDPSARRRVQQGSSIVAGDQRRRGPMPPGLPTRPQPQRGNSGLLGWRDIPREYRQQLQGFGYNRQDWRQGEAVPVDYTSGSGDQDTGLRSGDPLSWWLRAVQADPNLARRLPPPPSDREQPGARGLATMTGGLEQWWDRFRRLGGTEAARGTQGAAPQPQQPVAPIFGGGAGELPPRVDGVAQVPNFQPGPQPPQPPPGPSVPPQVPPGPNGVVQAPGFQPGPFVPRPPSPQGPDPGFYQPGAPSVPYEGPQSPQMVSNIRSGPQAPQIPIGRGGNDPGIANPAPPSRDLFPAHTPAWEAAHPRAVARRQAQQGQPSPIDDQNPGPDANSLLLNPQYEQGVRALDDELSATLAQIGVSRQEAQGINKLIKERLGLEQREDLSANAEAANARGLFDSGIRTQGARNVERGYRQNYEDLDLDFARTLRDLASGEIGARSGYSKGLAELLLGVGNQMAEENNSPIGMPTGARAVRKPAKKAPPKKKPKKRVRRRRKRR